MSHAHLDSNLAAINSAAVAFARYPACEHFRADLAAAQFHLRRPANLPPLIAILGGTGTGKSTLLNRLLQMDLTAANFRRTFTAGPIAVAADASHIPPKWLGIDHAILEPEKLPARGQPELLSIVIAQNDLTKSITLIDTPDLDGDQPTHHAQADRVFRWVDAVLFLVTPEKYQMTELLPYYRLTQRYGLQSIFVMNKVQEQAVADDYRQQIEMTSLFILARDDAAYEPPADFNLAALRSAIASIKPQPQADEVRIADLMDRLRDQLIEPARHDRREIDALAKSLTALETPAIGVDVNPLTQQLQRRLQQRSVLYLMGPARVLDRVRQVPKILARLPRTTWDLLRAGKLSRNGKDDLPADAANDQPNFRAVLIDQFTIVQSRIDDLLRSDSAIADRLQNSDYAASKLDPA
ncbi:MAG TPA: GTPase, partial [Tepidisphaeraceae bacterium]